MAFQFQQLRHDTAPVSSTSLIICNPNLEDRNLWILPAIQFLTMISIATIIVLITYTASTLRQNDTTKLYSKILLNEYSSCGLALILWRFASNSSEISLCSVVAILRHYLWLVCVNWMVVFSNEIHILCVKIKKKRSEEYTYYSYCFYAWGSALIITVISVAITFGIPRLGFTYYKLNRCWLGSRLHVLVAFRIPVGILTTLDLGYSLQGVYCLFRDRRDVSVSSGQLRTLYGMILHGIISVLFGLTFVLDLLDWTDPLFQACTLYRASFGILLTLAAFVRREGAEMNR